jgi:signal transduction histidine kinase
MAVARGLRLTGKVSAGSRHLAGVDRRDLADCVGNLIDNALKYTPAGGQIAVWIESATDVSDDDQEWTVVHVDDTGMGFDEEVLAEANGTGAFIFDAYRRGNNALAAGIPGSGLGLAIVQAVVEQVGGRIDVTSARGRGTHVALTLPAIGSGSPGRSIAAPPRAIHADPMRAGGAPWPALPSDQGDEKSRMPPGGDAEPRHAGN